MQNTPVLPKTHSTPHRKTALAIPLFHSHLRIYPAFLAMQDNRTNPKGSTDYVEQPVHTLAPHLATTSRRLPCSQPPDAPSAPNTLILNTLMGYACRQTEQATTFNTLTLKVLPADTTHQARHCPASIINTDTFYQQSHKKTKVCLTFSSKSLTFTTIC